MCGDPQSFAVYYKYFFCLFKWFKGDRFNFAEICKRLMGGRGGQIIWRDFHYHPINCEPLRNLDGNHEWETNEKITISNLILKIVSYVNNIISSLFIYKIRKLFIDSRCSICTILWAGTHFWDNHFGGKVRPASKLQGLKSKLRSDKGQNLQRFAVSVDQCFPTFFGSLHPY